MEIRTLLVLSDLDEDSLTGLRAAYALSDRHGAELVIGHVLVPRTLDPSDVKEFLQKHGFDRSKAQIEIEVDADVVSGIELLIRERKPQLIVMSSRRRRGLRAAFFQNLPVELLGEVNVPVLAFHSGQDQFEFRKTLVCVDGTPESQKLLDAAATLTEPKGELRALFAIEDSPLVVANIDIGRFKKEDLERAREAATKFLGTLRPPREDLTLSTDVRIGDAVAEILAAESEFGPDLIVVGSAGIGGRATFVLGQVPSGVIRNSPTTVLAVPTTAAGQS